MFSVIIPAYNEEENIYNVVESWYKCVELANIRFKIIIADSGSTDSTHDILLDLKQKYNNIEIISDTKKEHGSKLIALYKYAIEQGADYCFQTDSDGQTNPMEFEEFWKKRIDYDAIIGERGNRKDGIMRIVAEWVVCFLCRLYFGINIKDANAPFRLMKTEVLRCVDFLPNDYFIPNVMLTVLFIKHGRKVKDRIRQYRQHNALCQECKRASSTASRADQA